MHCAHDRRQRKAQLVTVGVVCEEIRTKGWSRLATRLYRYVFEPLSIRYAVTLHRLLSWFSSCLDGDYDDQTLVSTCSFSPFRRTAGVLATRIEDRPPEFRKESNVQISGPVSEGFYSQGQLR